jgi:hypothetical protein
MAIIEQQGRVRVKRLIAIFAIALAIVPIGASAASATDKVDCLFYQTFRERDPGDCIL